LTTNCGKDIAVSEEFREAFLKANANKDFIFTQFTEVLRDLVRAIAVRDDPSIPIYRAVEQWGFVTDLISRCEGRISAYEMFSVAVNSLREAEEPDGTHDELSLALLSAARTGMSLYVEASCRDNAVKGRVSQREAKFLSAIEWMEISREKRRR
jgi:hypothetical protein